MKKVFFSFLLILTFSPVFCGDYIFQNTFTFGGQTPPQALSTSIHSTFEVGKLYKFVISYDRGVWERSEDYVFVGSVYLTISVHDGPVWNKGSYAINPQTDPFQGESEETSFEIVWDSEMQEFYEMNDGISCYFETPTSYTVSIYRWDNSGQESPFWGV